jgi:uncharacterized integral membrane protein (TIGR00698 family)
MSGDQLRAVAHSWISAGINRRDAGRNPTLVERSLLGCPVEEIPKFIPGIILTGVLVIVAISAADWLNDIWAYQGVISSILVAIVLGMMVRNSVGLPEIFLPGVGFATDRLLKLGIILMGVRLSFSDVATLSVWVIPIIIGCVLAGLVVTTAFTRLLGLPDRLGTLIAVGSSICGTSAIVAAAPGVKATDDEAAYAIANITVFGIIAMLAYPYLANLLFSGEIAQAGLFMGTSIPNTAQVAGAGLVFDQSFGSSANAGAADVAVVTKLVRNVMMVGVIPLMAIVYSRRVFDQNGSHSHSRVKILGLFPIFIIGFLLLAMMRSIGDAGVGSGNLAMGLWGEDAWRTLISNVKDWAGYLLAAAMAGVGLGTSLKTLKGLGLRPFAVGLAATFVVGLTSVLFVLVLGPLVDI